jgi:hypothetical protein
MAEQEDNLSIRVDEGSHADDGGDMSFLEIRTGSTAGVTGSVVFRDSY